MNKLPTIVKKQFPGEFLSAGWKIFNEKKYNHLDFIRNSYTAQFSDKRGTYWAILRKKSDKNSFQASCSCNTYMRHMNCHHLAALFFIIYSKNQGDPDIENTLAKFYEQSLWINLAKLYYEHWGDNKLDIRVSIKRVSVIPEIKINGNDESNQEIFEFILPGQYFKRIIQKYRWQFFADLDDKDLPKGDSEEALEHLTSEKSELEIRMNLAGYKSWLQKFEESYWFDFSKVWFFGFDDIGYSVNYMDKTQSLKIFSGDKRFIFSIQKPQIANIIKKLAQNEAIRHTLNIAEEVAILNYSLEVTNEHDLKITPVLLLPGEKDPCFLTKDSNMKPTVFGNYIYLHKKGFFPYERKIKYYDSTLFGLHEVSIPNDDIPKIIHEYRRFIDVDEFYFVSTSLKNRDIIKNIKSIDLFVDDIQDDWLYLSVKYRIGNEIISLYEIYQTLRSGKRYLIAKNHWIDLFSADFVWIQKLIEAHAIDLEKFGAKEARLKVNKLNFIKLNAHLPKKGRVDTHQSLSRMLDHLTNLKPTTETPSLEGRKYQLRDYQKTGYEWFWFLYENNLSGLLCDDMGLGKTYQSLALIDGITLFEDRPMNFLIVTPTSVLPHWHDKLKELKKKVHLHLYYGSERNLKNLKKQKYAVVLTSYGILRNDLEKLSDMPFELAIFDEIQTAKNKASLTNAALNQLKSKMRIGLTGTPIENNLNELKALFDIILPDYLGSDNQFRKHYINPIERQENKAQLEELQKIIRPFMFRRTKNQVLEELPPKIEEIRKCELSLEQVKLYQDVINTRAQTLIAQLYRKSENIPYIHIFAVLSYLKQICNHPSQLQDGCLDYAKYQSGKWDLFCELLEESLNSGFKVVVFSQYLNMLALIEAYLKDNRIEFATIKGSTTNRKEMIERFNNDPKCKVFTGSLRASGFGIDLIGGSVVIHYDRWWNAAREDQATDRVHRIGQTRGVQVFKLVTEGTLEEKIDRLIRKKKKLMNDLVKEDDANIVKGFNREELIELLTFGD
jgi:SNF2 family DNA or RNA helicase